MTDGRDEKAARLAAALRANLKRRKGQARGRDDLSGRDPKRRDTPLHQSGAVCEDAPAASLDPLTETRRDDGEEGN